jgi:hypothetical protein
MDELRDQRDVIELVLGSRVEDLGRAVDSLKRLKLDAAPAVDLDEIWSRIGDTKAELSRLEMWTTKAVGWYVDSLLQICALRLDDAKLFVDRNLRQLPFADILSGLAVSDPDVPINMGQWSDMTVVTVFNFSWLDFPRYRLEIYSALAELTKRANAKCVTVGDFIVNFTREHCHEFEKLRQRYTALSPAEKHTFVKSLARRGAEEPDDPSGAA